MNLFGNGPKDEAARLAQERREASQRTIEAGGLPLEATERLKEQASRQGTPKHFFTSDLSVNEFLLCRESGYEPLGLVMGSSVYHLGWQRMSNASWWYQSCELPVLTQAQYDVRNLAMRRMTEEATLLGADGVVGVRLERAEVAEGLIEFKAVGTAIRHPSDRKTSDGRPFMSSLTGQDLWSLDRAGFVPVGFGFGNCIYFQLADWRSQNALMSWNNMELTSLTQGFYVAREIAMERLTSEFERTDVDGIVGVTIEAFSEPCEGQQGLMGLIIHYTAYGTAVSRLPKRVQAAVRPVLPLVDT